jgi:peptidoglycan/LPS O-acetylase OafA/YrhL
MKTAPAAAARKLKYQRHVDGLRALAVLAVVFYHFGQPAFGGGYVGVDVFFVISGYLISGLIITEMADTGGFGFRRFYSRRVRRLFPAMLVTLAGSLLCALILFSPAQIHRFGNSLAATALSVSNIYFWSEAGYFNVSSGLKPLLHTWSLAVEEQFYLLWPALIWLLYRRRSRKSSIWILLLIGLGSLALNLVWIWGEFDEEAASTIFYLTPFRIYEFAIGALGIYLAPLLRHRLWLQEACMATGLGLIAWAIFNFSDTTVFPGTSALIPCTGALLVIVSGNSRIFGWLLTNRVAVGCGLMSYSIYLVHWPLLVFYKYYLFREPSQTEYTILFLTILLLSYLMYRFIETRFRRSTQSQADSTDDRRNLIVNLGLMLCLCVAGSAVGLAKNQRWGKGDTLSAQAVQQGHERRFQSAASGCTVLTLDDPARCDLNRPYQVLVMGNSHEVDAYNAFHEIYASDQRVNLISFGQFNKCRLEFGPDGPASPVLIRECKRRFAILRDAVFVRSLDAMVLGFNNPFGDQALIGNKRSIWRVVHHLRALNPELTLVVMGSYINTVRDCSELYNRFHSFDACKNREFLATTGYGERQSSTLPEARATDYLYIDKMGLLCPSGSVESCVMEAYGEPAFYDDGHLSTGFSRYLGERIYQAYGTELVKMGFPNAAGSRK